MFNVQRTITPKVDKPELRFMCFSHRLIFLYICVNSGENILDQSYGADTNDGSADGRTLKFGTVLHNTLATFCGGA